MSHDATPLVITIAVTLILFGCMFYFNGQRQEELYRECIAEKELTKFECKALAKEMTRIDY